MAFSISFVSPTSTFASSDIVQTNQVYTYKQMTTDLKELASKYPNLIELKSIGKSEYGRDIWAVKMGKGDKSVLFNGSHHAREWITSMLNMKMIEEYAKAYTNNQTVGSYPARTILDSVSIYFIPMVNPDGVTLEQGGLTEFPKDAQTALIAMNKGSKDFTAWKANAKGVDLNRQYPADWANIKNNASGPANQNYKGTQPLAAKEAKLLYDFTLQLKPLIAVSYHSSGEILYWSFHTKPENLNRDKTIATKISKITGYSLIQPTTNPSGGGYTDWFIQQFGLPAFTPEVSVPVGERSVPLASFSQIWNENKTIGLYIASEAQQLGGNKVDRNALYNQINELANQVKKDEGKLKSGELNESQANELNLSILNNKKKIVDLYAKTGDLQTAIRRQEEITFNPLLNLQTELKRLGQLYDKEKQPNQAYVFVNGKRVQFSDTQPFIQIGTTYIPVRYLFEFLDATISWDEKAQKVTIQKGDTNMQIFINKNIAYLNGKQVTLSTPPFTKQNRTVVPLRFVSEYFGITVNWNEDARGVLLTM